MFFRVSRLTIEVKAEVIDHKTRITVDGLDVHRDGDKKDLESAVGIMKGTLLLNEIFVQELGLDEDLFNDFYNLFVHSVKLLAATPTISRSKLLTTSVNIKDLKDADVDDLNTRIAHLTEGTRSFTVLNTRELLDNLGREKDLTLALFYDRNSDTISVITRFKDLQN